MIRVRFGYWIPVSVFLLFACRLDAVEDKDDVRIVSISPPTSKPLRAGEIVNFEIKVEYLTVLEEVSRFQVEIFRGVRGEQQQSLAYTAEEVAKGRGVRTIRTSVEIPVTGSIQVKASVVGLDRRPESQRHWLFSDKREYKVLDQSGKQIKPTGGGGDSIKIVSVYPPPGSTLRIGEQVHFELKVDYDLRSAKSGRVEWTPAGTRFSKIVPQGKGTVTFSENVQVRMGTTMVQLFADGYASSLAFSSQNIQNFRYERPQANPEQTLPEIAVAVAGEYEDHLRIVSISPPIEKPLQIGETVDFEIVVEYEMRSADLGIMGIFIGNGWDNRAVRKGKGMFTVTRRILIPKSAASGLVVRALSDIRKYTVSPEVKP